MQVEQFRKVNQAEPFKPYTIHLADGRMFTVRHPEFVAISPQGRSIAVVADDGTFDMIDLLLVTSLHVGNGQAASS